MFPYGALAPNRLVIALGATDPFMTWIAPVLFPVIVEEI